MYSPLRWPGGKARLAKAILTHVREHAAYVETCCGGAAVFWAKARDVSDSEILNDADGELINFYRVLHRQGKRLVAEVDAMPYSRALFSQQLAEKPRCAFGRARRFWYVNRVAFGAKLSSPTFGVKASGRASVLAARILRDLDLTIERMRGVLFECHDVVHLVALYDRPTTLFYVDPPYYSTSQPYAQGFGQGDHKNLAARLQAIDGAFLLSYDDCPEIREMYSTCHMQEMAVRYAMGRNSRSGRKAGSSGKAAELLISNRPLKPQPAGE